MKRSRAYSRRAVIRALGGAGGLVGMGALLQPGADAGPSGDKSNPEALVPRTPIGGRHAGAGHVHGSGGDGTVGVVDHVANGFDPHVLLTDFDRGFVSKDVAGRTVREYQLVAYPKTIEIAPGVRFEAWTYNGRVPGPTIRATEGDRVRITLVNASEHSHTIHTHGIHPAAMDGVPGAGEAAPGETFVYDFIAAPAGTHLYHCHSSPFVEHIHRGLYGAFIVDPRARRPDAHEMVFVLNGFDTDFDRSNNFYAANTIAFAYRDQPITIERGRLQRAHIINITEFDPVNSFHLHGNFFSLYRTGTGTEPDEYTDIVTMGQAERHMIEFTYDEPGTYMFHAHQGELSDLGWMSAFEVT